MRLIELKELIPDDLDRDGPSREAKIILRNKNGEVVFEINQIDAEFTVTDVEEKHGHA